MEEASDQITCFRRKSKHGETSFINNWRLPSSKRFILAEMCMIAQKLQSQEVKVAMTINYCVLACNNKLLLSTTVIQWINLEKSYNLYQVKYVWNVFQTNWLSKISRWIIVMIIMLMLYLKSRALMASHYYCMKYLENTPALISLNVSKTIIRECLGFCPYSKI